MPVKLVPGQSRAGIQAHAHQTADRHLRQTGRALRRAPGLHPARDLAPRWAAMAPAALPAAPPVMPPEGLPAPTPMIMPFNLPDDPAAFAVQRIGQRLPIHAAGLLLGHAAGAPKYTVERAFADAMENQALPTEQRPPGIGSVFCRNG